MRAQYDQQHVHLPGDGIRFSWVGPEIVSTDVYNAIPRSASDKDPLRSPRRIELSKGSYSSYVCASIPQLRDGDRLRIATVKNVIGTTATFSTGLDDRGQATLCAGSPSIDALTSGARLEFAVQIVRG